MSDAVVVLAAGASSRLGAPKQLVTIAGSSLLRRAAETALAAATGPVIVVLGDGAPALRGELAGLAVTIVVNDDWREGMASSIRAGVGALDNAVVEGCVVMTVDQPAVSAEHLRRLRAAGSPTGIAASGYGGVAGVPAYFGRQHFAQLLALGGDRGARDMLRGLPAAAIVSLPGGEKDVDRPADTAGLRPTD